MIKLWSDVGAHRQNILNKLLPPQLSNEANERKNFMRDSDFEWKER